MKIVCQQAHYFPWLGYFDLFAKADAFVYLDNVQWIRQGHQHRTRIMDANGKPRWLTLPVKGHGHRAKTLKDMQVADVAWGREHMDLLRATYGKAPRFKDQLEPLLKSFFEKTKKEKFLVDIAQESTWLFWEPLGLNTELHWSSDLPEVADPNERLIRICQHFGAKEYYSSLGSTRYLDLSQFREAGIRVYWQHLRSHFPDDPLRPIDLSILDWLAHHDIASAAAAIKPAPFAWPSIVDADPISPR